ncbi:MAG: hypothetical protein ABIQ93_08205 [Saprospiraceae bacterium]
MPKQKNDHLLQLIRSLTKAEKRHFRLFAQRNQSSEAMLFLQLFDYLDQRGEYDEADLLKKMPAAKKSQLPNLKAHLNRQLLTSLRLLGKNQNEDIQLREMLDWAKVLYSKGLYRPSLDMLAKTKERALQGHFSTLALEVVEFEKLIESQYITNSIVGRVEVLSAQSLHLIEGIASTNRYANLSLQMYALYLKTGFARNQADYAQVRAAFHQLHPGIPFAELDFWGQVYYCQSYVWLYHVGQAFTQCYRYSLAWVRLFEAVPMMKRLHPALYLKGMHNLLGTLFNCLDHDRFVATLADFERFPEEIGGHTDRNVEGLFELYRYIHRINRHYLEGTFAEGLHLVPELTRCMEQNTYNWDDHRVLVFHYRIACLYFAVSDYEQALHYLYLIINRKNPDYRADIQCFARILALIAHFELGNATLVEYQLKSVYRFLLKMEDLHAVQREILHFVRRTPGMLQAQVLDEFRQLHTTLIPLQADPYERRPFLYLDIISWLESKLEKRPLPEIVREKFSGRAKANLSGRSAGIF